MINQAASRSDHRRTGPDLCQNGAHRLFCNLSVIMSLQIQPHFSGPSEVAGEAQGGVSGDGALALYDLVDAARGHADVLSKAVFRQAERQEEILSKDFTGMNGNVLFHGWHRLMIINDFNFMRAVWLPLEADAPLIVDTDGMLSFAVALEHFQSVSGWDAQLNQLRDGVELDQLAQGRALDVRREGADLLQLEQAGSIFASK